MKTMMMTPTTASLFSTKTRKICDAMPPEVATSPPEGGSNSSGASVSPISPIGSGDSAPSVPKPGSSEKPPGGFISRAPEPNAWIGDGVQDVGQQRADHRGDSDDQGRAEHQRNVDILRRLHGEQPHSGVVEHIFDDQRPAHDGRQ